MQLKLSEEARATLKKLVHITGWIAAAQITLALALVWDIYFGTAMQSPRWMQIFGGDPVGHAQLLIVLSLAEIAVLAAARRVLSHRPARVAPHRPQR